MNSGASEQHDIIRRHGASEWWRGAVGYEIYIRSFFDTNGDGLGDLNGITAKLDYLQALGVDVIWITPFYPSPGFDHGYDVSDYCNVDPAFGTLDDFDRLVASAHRHGLRVFIDIVPNHTSSHHPWFQAAISDTASPYRNYYIFRPAGPTGGPPNNWVSHFGGSAWSPDPAGTGQYYLHLFLPEQPDLNWDNPAVMEEFRKILVFWCERGVDGFRIDVAHGLTKDPEFRDNMQLRPVTPDMHPKDVFNSFVHTYDMHRVETRDIFRQWRKIVEPYGAVLLGELDARDIGRFSEYVAGGDALDLGFVLKLAHLEWEPETILADLFTYERASHGGAAWALSNHDQPRALSRLGGEAVGLRRVMAVTSLMVCLDGMTFIYQGEELGLENSVLSGESQDPISTRNAGAAGRDVARGPMPWDESPVNGFTTAPRAWLETVPVLPEMTVSAQIENPDSTWHGYRSMIGLRKCHPELWTEPLEVVSRADKSAVVERGSLIIIANFDRLPYEYSPSTAFTVEYETRHGAAHVDDLTLTILPESTVIIRLGA